MAAVYLNKFSFFLKLNSNVTKDLYCWICHLDNDLINCNECPRAYHLKCICLTVSLNKDWMCEECEVKIMFFSSLIIIFLLVSQETTSVRKRKTCDFKSTTGTVFFNA
jgi:hypothetical protein